MPRGYSCILYLLGGHTTQHIIQSWSLKMSHQSRDILYSFTRKKFFPMPIPMPVVRKNSMSVKFLFLHIIGQAVPIVPHQSTVVPAIQFLFFLDCQPSLVVLLSWFNSSDSCVMYCTWVSSHISNIVGVLYCHIFIHLTTLNSNLTILKSMNSIPSRGEGDWVWVWDCRLF